MIRNTINTFILLILGLPFFSQSFEDTIDYDNLDDYLYKKNI